MKLLIGLAWFTLVITKPCIASDGIANDAVNEKGNVQAEAISSLSTQAGATNPRIVEAEALFAANKIAELKPLLAALKQENPPHLAVLFLAGMVANAEGDYAAAANEFRAMLTRDPSLIRPRLELALALQKSGDRQAAKYHYEQVLAANLPDNVKRNVYQQLGDIRERLPSLRLSVDLVSDSNPKQTTNSRVVQIGGLTYTLNDAGSAKSVFGLLVTADASLPLPSNPSWYAHAWRGVRISKTRFRFNVRRGQHWQAL